MSRRLDQLTIFEKKARTKGFLCIAGVDEAGRGPLAGPVVAAACILPEALFLRGIDDSKKLTPEERESLYEKIKENPEIHYGIGIVSSLIIDQINILRATMAAMVAAVKQLQKKPDYILVDGNQLPSFDVPCEGIVAGDTLSQSIMAASIIAKYTRDQIMLQCHLEWPQYGFKAHKGYGTPQHLEALKLHGPCPIHRKTFKPVRS